MSHFQQWLPSLIQACQIHHLLANLELMYVPTEVARFFVPAFTECAQALMRSRRLSPFVGVDVAAAALPADVSSAAQLIPTVSVGTHETSMIILESCIDFDPGICVYSPGKDGVHTRYRSHAQNDSSIGYVMWICCACTPSVHERRATEHVHV